MRGVTTIAATAVLVALAGCAHKPVINTAVVPTQKPKYDPHDAAAYNMQLGLAYMERGELAIAKDKLERAAREAPKDPNVHAALALLNERLGNTPKADEEFRIALTRAPHNPDIRNNYAVYLCRTKRTDQGVRELLDVAHDPLYNTPEVAYTNAGVCLRSEHRNDEAQRSFLAAISLRPGFAEAVFQLASLELERNQLAAARGRIDGYFGTFTATPDLLLLGVRVARAQGDRLAEQRYMQRLRVDFPDSDQTRALAARPPNSF
ncbi:MAG TPA: type IV pilus biogenesis/stability protein PilW [Steroidobacteraceae bacterium]|nr:type IV pilus biogenesis/stability protein PilW [Steroidobacteraceae bacterium]